MARKQRKLEAANYHMWANKQDDSAFREMVEQGRAESAEFFHDQRPESAFTRFLLRIFVGLKTPEARQKTALVGHRELMERDAKERLAK